MRSPEPMPRHPSAASLEKTVAIVGQRKLSGQLRLCLRGDPLRLDLLKTPGVGSWGSYIKWQVLTAGPFGPQLVCHLAQPVYWAQCWGTPLLSAHGLALHVHSCKWDLLLHFLVLSTLRFLFSQWSALLLFVSQQRQTLLLGAYRAWTFHCSMVTWGNLA